MKRRAFIKNSSASLAVLIAGMPLIERNRRQSREIYKMTEAIQEDEVFVNYTVYIVSEGVASFKEYKSNDSYNQLKIVRQETGGGEMDFIYQIKKVKVSKAGDSFTYHLEVEKKSEENRDSLTKKKMDKKLKLEVKFKDSIIVKTSKSKALFTAKYYTPPATNDTNAPASGCFLTTACVQYKGLPDDCSELQTLRALRDEFMRSTPQGVDMVNEYYKTAPLIVNEIQAAPNRNEILAYAYQHMILPSVALVKSNQRALAVDYYKHFMQAMKVKYLIG